MRYQTSLSKDWEGRRGRSAASSRFETGKHAHHPPICRCSACPGFPGSARASRRCQLAHRSSDCREHPPACSSAVENGVAKMVTANLAVRVQHLKRPPAKPQVSSSIIPAFPEPQPQLCPPLLGTRCSGAGGPG